MDCFLAHFILLLWFSIGASRRLTSRLTDRLLIAALLAWGNIVVTSLVLSALHRLGSPFWFFGSSCLILALTTLLVLRVTPGPVYRDSPAGATGSRSGFWLEGLFGAVITVLAAGCVAIAWTYPPNNPEALITLLPRAEYYLGQNSLGHFSTVNHRMVLWPFNYDLLHLFGLIYGPAHQSLNIFNLFAWVLCGVAVYRLCRSCASSHQASLIACWLVLTSAAIFSQATAAMPELPSAVAGLCTLILILEWRHTGKNRYCVLAGLAAGLAVGSSLVVALIALFGLLLFLLFLKRIRCEPMVIKLSAWILPATIAATAGGSFIFINALSGSPWFLASGPNDHILSLGEFFVKACNDLNPVIRPPIALSLFDESTVGFGLTGVLFGLCAVICAFRWAKLSLRVRWLTALGFLSVIPAVFLSGDASAESGLLVPTLLLFSPCLALSLDWPNIQGRKILSHLVSSIVILVACIATWSAGVYLCKNTSRPLVPLLNASIAPPPTPDLPLLMDLRLSKETRVNINSDGRGESIFSLMAQGHNQRFTSSNSVDPNALNIVSRSSLARSAAYFNPAKHHQPLYTVIAMPEKRTAGVEFLGTIGTGASARDYFGIERNAGQKLSTDPNRAILVTIDNGRDWLGEPPRTRFGVAGLNPEDGAQIAISEELEDGTLLNLASLTQNGVIYADIREPFRWLRLHVRDVVNGEEFGQAVVAFQSTAEEEIIPIDPLQPTKSTSVFVTELVMARDAIGVVCDGLLPTEGPFPQWNLPSLRWARKSDVSFKIPAKANCALLQLSFSVRLHVRKHAVLEVLLNGQPVQRLRIDDPSKWFEQTLNLTPQAGENVLEFKDIPIATEPDWLDYLERYPDVKEYLVSAHKPLEKGAEEHYEMAGRAEGRTVHLTAYPNTPSDGYFFMFRKIRLEGFSTP